jgi:1-deoxy-D-xylulose-5-phosphate reductoisomerase
LYVEFNTNKMLLDTPKRLAVIGSTGSIGTQTLEIVDKHPERYKINVLAAGTRVNELIEQARKFRPALAIIARHDLYNSLHDALSPLGIETAAGADALADAMQRDDIDMVVTATVGYSGLEPTIRAIRANKDIALANKETLVVAGALINKLLKQSKSRIFPVDSEHSAIAQCLAGEDPSCVRNLIVTASGGPFRLWKKEDLEHATAADALKHPNWSMGAKITIDSATMLNKAFELIEAHYLFNVEPKHIHAVVHPQSVVHSMIEFVDGAIKAQLGVPDMKLPIAYALGESHRLADVSSPLTLDAMTQLTFERPDYDKFPCLSLAPLSLERGGNTACIVNAANEVANLAFRQGKIGFNDIYRTITSTLEHTSFVASPTYDDYVATNSAAVQYAEHFITTL